MSQKVDYIRCDNKIYALDGDKRQLLHDFPSISKAKQWVRESAKPGSVRVEQTQKPAQQLQRQELAALVQAQMVDRNRQDRNSAPSVRPYVMPDRDASSFLRERSGKRQRSRDARNTRANYGGS